MSLGHGAWTRRSQSLLTVWELEARFLPEGCREPPHAWVVVGCGTLKAPGLQVGDLVKELRSDRYGRSAVKWVLSQFFS